jgi:hypothetical protein
VSALARRLAGLVLTLAATAALAAGPLSPAGTAFLKAEQNRIEREFIERAAGIAGVSPGVVSSGMPRGPRITDTGRRVIEAVEQSTGRPLDAGQRAAIQAADDTRKAELARAREAAARR